MAALGGWPGLLVALFTVRHKVRKAAFLAPLALLALANAVAIWFLLQWLDCLP